MERWIRDFTHAARSLARSPGFTLVVVATLAIGATATIFSVVDAVLLKPLPFPNADRLVYIAGTAPGTDQPEELGVADELYLAYKESVPGIEDIALYGEPLVRVAGAGGAYFQTMGVELVRGRYFERAEEERGLPFVMISQVVSLAALLAVVLGAVGIYGVLSYRVTSRSQEIGVRMALGAEAKAVRRMFVWQGGRVAPVGILVGTLAAAGLTSYISALLFNVRRLDVPAFAATSAVMFAVALLASYVPARRASRVDPIVALRAE
jgi:hypothetical protein